MSTYTDALLAYNRAAEAFLSEERNAAWSRRPDVIRPPDYVDRTEEAARALAQAGDVLEREMEAMMRKIAVSER